MTFIDEIYSFADDALDFFVDVLDAIIDFVAWIIVGIISFFEDIVPFFHDLVPSGKVSEQKLHSENTKAIVLNIVEDNLTAGKFKKLDIGLKSKSKGILVKGLYDKDKKAFIKETTEINEYEELDQETKEELGDEDMLVLV